MRSCRACGTPYISELGKCPHCGSTEFMIRGEEMAKNTKADGASNAVLSPPVADEPEVIEPEVVEPEPEAPLGKSTGTGIGEAFGATIKVEIERPAGNASIERWAVYLESLGGTADGLTRAQMIEAADAIEGQEE